MVRGPARYKKISPALPPSPSLVLYRLQYVGWHTSLVGGWGLPHSRQISLLPRALILLPQAPPPAIPTMRQSRKHHTGKRNTLASLISS